MIDKENIEDDNPAEENLKGAGQRILGTLEMLGGVITGDPATTAEGEFNDDVGKVHQDTAREMAAGDAEAEDSDAAI